MNDSNTLYIGRRVYYKVTTAHYDSVENVILGERVLSGIVLNFDEAKVAIASEDGKCWVKAIESIFLNEQDCLKYSKIFN